MKINITKGQDGCYTLKIQSGHFGGELTGIGESQIDELIKSLDLIRNSQLDNTTIVWNPRSRRHERISVQQ